MHDRMERECRAFYLIPLRNFDDVNPLGGRGAINIAGWEKHACNPDDDVRHGCHPHSRDSSLTALRSRRGQPVLFGPPSALMLSGWAVKAVAFRPQELQKPMFCLLPTSFEFAGWLARRTARRSAPARARPRGAGDSCIAAELARSA